VAGGAPVEATTREEEEKKTRGAGKIWSGKKRRKSGVFY